MTKLRRLRAASLGPMIAVVLASHPAVAQDAASEQRKVEARDLAQQGDAAFKIGRCDRAVPLWKEANSKFPAPTILFRVARCQALLGHVVDATGTLEALLALPQEPDAPQAFQEAKAQAMAELPAVRARIAFLTVDVDTGGVSTVPQVRIDDRSVGLRKQPVPVDPGRHVVRISAGDASWERTIVMQEGGQQTVRVSVGVHYAPAPSRTQRTVGYVIGGLGLASMTVGAIFGVSAANTSRELEDVCGTDRKQCPADRQGDIDSLKTNAVVTDLTLGAGAALFAAGAIVVLTEPTPHSEAPRLVLFPVGLGAAVQGTF